MNDDYLELLSAGLTESLSAQVKDALSEQVKEPIEEDTLLDLSRQVMAAMDEQSIGRLEQSNKQALSFNYKKLETPYYIVDESLLRKNLEVLERVIREAGCHILLAQKAFSMFHMYPLIGKYLNGTTASGLFEAKLGKEEMGKENHIFSPAYKDSEFDEITSLCDHIVFNSFSQLERFKDRALKAGCSVGLRVNPEFSTQSSEHSIYDPCAPGSRLGITKDGFLTARKRFQIENGGVELDDHSFLDGVEGLHFHTLCEQPAEDLVATLDAFERSFGQYLYKMKWLNLGGGHHITREDYDVDQLITTIRRLKETYGVEVYLEPGEAIALNSGFLVATVMDFVVNDITIAILDTSAACHMPDVLEMPYRPNIIGSGKPREKEYAYRLGGPTCLSGDIIGDYSFDEPLKIGDRLVFCDMAIYSMVKNNTFNGMPLPSIAMADEDGQVHIVKQFGYEDFKNRLS